MRATKSCHLQTKDTESSWKLQVVGVQAVDTQLFLQVAGNGAGICAVHPVLSSVLLLGDTFEVKGGGLLVES